MRVGLLTNLRSGRNRRGVHHLLNHLSRLPEVVHVETSDAEAVPDALADLASQDVEILAVNGGDGTLSHALTSILAHGEFEGRIPMVAVLRGGRTNMSALDLGSHRNSMRALDRLVAAVREDRIKDLMLDRPVLRIANRYEGHRDVRYGMFFGAGVIARGIEMVHRSFPQGRAQGVFGASLVTGGLLTRLILNGETGGALSPDKIHVLADGVPVERGESRLVMATSLDRLFLGLRPFWGTEAGGVRLTAISAAAERLGLAAPGILAGRPPRFADEAKGYVSRNADRVALRLDCSFTVDGELIEPRSEQLVTLTSDRRVRFLRA